MVHGLMMALRDVGGLLRILAAVMFGEEAALVFLCLRMPLLYFFSLLGQIRVHASKDYAQFLTRMIQTINLQEAVID